MRTRRVRPDPIARSAFTGFCFPPEVIVLAVRWYLRFALSYRDLEELLAERGSRSTTPPCGSLSNSSAISIRRTLLAASGSSSGPVASSGSCSWAGWLIASPDRSSEAPPFPTWTT